MDKQEQILRPWEKSVLEQIEKKEQEDKENEKK